MNIRGIIDNKSLKLKNDLFRLALMDKQMSGDESRLINSAISNLSELSQYSRKVLMDNMITEVEIVNLQLFIKKIGEDCMTIANEDNKITQDEKIVLTHIRKTIFELIELVTTMKPSEAIQKQSK